MRERVCSNGDRVAEALAGELVGVIVEKTCLYYTALRL
jgi:hypothetical protein